MNKAISSVIIFILTFLISAMNVFAQDTAMKADELLSAGGLDNYKQAMEIYKTLAEKVPDNFEYNWKYAKAIYKYGFETEKLNLSDWEDTCKVLGKRGMKFANKAIELGPDKPHGYFYYGRNVGIYADAVSILTALKEGLKDKTQENLEKAYDLDRSFEKGATVYVLGRYWQLVPWPFSDKDKALELYREFQKTEFYDDPDNIEARIYMAEILADQWGSEPKKEAGILLNEALKMTNDNYWKKKANEVQKDL